MKLTLFLLIFVSQFCLAQTIEKLPCHGEFKNLLSEWKVTGEWTKEFKAGLEKSFLISTTQNFGEWVMVQKIDQGTVLARADERGRIEVTYKTDKCMKEVKPYVNDKIPSKFFTDQDIGKYIRAKKTGVIYVWSPRMGLSEKGLKEIKLATKAMKLPVLLLMDKDVTDKEAEDFSKKIGKDATRRIDSFDFKMRNVTMHFPALIFFKDGKILSGVKYGHENAEGYQRDLRNKLR